MQTLISISNARKELPPLFREIQKNPHTIFQISVRHDPIAEIRSAQPMVASGEAVDKLIRLRKKLSRFRQRQRPGTCFPTGQGFSVPCVTP